jgi:hypothetical protein
MFKVIAIFCVLTAVLAGAKPTEKEEKPAVKFVQLTQERPNRHNGNRPDSDGRLTLYSGTNCTGAKRIFACDGSCYDINGLYHSFKVRFIRFCGIK